MSDRMTDSVEGNSCIEEGTSSMSRRSFIGGVAALAASAYSLSVPDDVAAHVTDGDDSTTQTVTSPDGNITVTIDASEGGLRYRVVHDGTTVIADSALGFEFQNQDAFRDGLTVTGSERSTVNTTWRPVWDQYDEIREQYHELRVGLEERKPPGRTGTLAVRVFDDGLGFRFVFSDTFGDPFVITSERTEYNFAGDYTSWWIPNDYNNFEVEYERTSLSDVSSTLETEWGGEFDGVHTPMTMRTDEDRYVSVHEAALDDYASLAITPTDGTDFESTLAPLPDGTKVAASAPHMTPWRTIQICSRPGALVESNLIVNLNEDYSDDVFSAGTDWIEPQKFIGIWWLMITDRADWEYQGPHTGTHGAQTGRAKQYMDFASEHGISGVLIEGWNQGWSSYPGDGSAFDFTSSYPDFDLQEVTSYGPSLDPPTQMTMHNETAGDFQTYESQLEAAFGLYDDLGVRTIKNGYVADSGDLAGEGHNHHNQMLVNHHTLVAETAAANRQLLDIHEPIHPTGRRRTYPNLMTREGVKGQEYDSFGSISPEHHVTFPFTRMLGGPVEFTPGIFDMESGSGGIETTRAKQLAMYPTYLSGLQMVADLPSSYLADQPATLRVGSVAQAEYGDRQGFSTAARWANAQGEAYVPIDPNVSSGSTISWTVTAVDRAGDYELHLRYASDAENNAVPADTDRTATVMVNGSTTTTISVPSTDYWDVWETVSTTVSLESGDNEITLLVADEDTGGFNLDAIAVTETDAPMPEPTQDPIRGPTAPEFQFIEDVPAAGWDDTRVLDSSIGEYMITARRKGDEWYVGAMTDENGRALDVPLDFLAPGARGSAKSTGEPDDAASGPKYVAEIYSDGIDAAFGTNHSDVRVDTAIVDPSTTVVASMIESGGTAIRLRPARGSEIVELPTYKRPVQDVTVSIANETFVQEPFITATGSNSGAYIGGTTIELVVDGDRKASANVRYPPQSSERTYSSSYTIDTPGTYDVTVRTADGTSLAMETVRVKPPEVVASLSDPADDDEGPGNYTYPTADEFEPGAFDLRSFTVEQTPSRYEFTFDVTNLYNAFGSDRGFSPQMFVLWVRDPNKNGGSRNSLKDLQATVSFERSWHYRVEISGFTKSVVDATGTPVTDDEGNAVDLYETVDTSAGTVTLTLNRAAFDGVDATELEVVPMVQCEDRGTLRPVEEQHAQYVFGGATSGAVDMAPRIMDVIVPGDTSQEKALTYTTDRRASLPFISMS